MIHIVTPRHGAAVDLQLCSFERHGFGIYPYELPTTRALMQVSKEARKAVLAGRQLRHLDSDKYKVAVFAQWWGCITGGKNDPKFQKYFFVNWDIDLVYFPRTSRPDVRLFLEESRLHDIKRIAIDIQGPDYNSDEDVTYAPSYDDLLASTSIRELSMLSELTTIYLVLNAPAVAELYHVSILFAEGESDSDESDEDDEEDEKDYVDYLFDWLCLHETDQYDFHHIGSETYRYFRKPITCLFTQPVTLTQVEIPFPAWVDEMISATERDARCFCGPGVDVQMVMELFLEDTGEFGSYYRGCIDEEVEPEESG